MTITLSLEARDLVQRARQNLAAAGPEGHISNIFWSVTGSCRCTWGRIMEAHSPSHRLDSIVELVGLQKSVIGREIEDAFFSLHGNTINEVNYGGFDRSLAALDALILATEPARLKVEAA